MTLFTFGLAKKVLLADAIPTRSGRTSSAWRTALRLLRGPRQRLPTRWSGWASLPTRSSSISTFSALPSGHRHGQDAGPTSPELATPISPRHPPSSGGAGTHDAVRLVQEYVCIFPRRQPQGPQATDLPPVRRRTAPGIWHGANWNFICWGLYYFVLLALESSSSCLPQKGRVWPHIYTLFLVVVGWGRVHGATTQAWSSACCSRNFSSLPAA